MPVYTYTRDFRNKAGKTASAPQVKENLSDIQDEVNSLAWDNVDTGSLDQSHTKGYAGGDYKVVSGGYGELSSHSPGWAPAGSLSFESDASSAVFVAASVSFIQAEPPTVPDPAIEPTLVRLRLRADDSLGNSLGSWTLSAAQAMEASGGSGITWAFSPKSTAVQTVYLDFINITGRPASSINPVKVNLTAFVVNR